jgi:hypothetical protein
MMDILSGDDVYAVVVTNQLVHRARLDPRMMATQSHRLAVNLKTAKGFVPTHQNGLHEELESTPL